LSFSNKTSLKVLTITLLVLFAPLTQTVHHATATPSSDDYIVTEAQANRLDMVTNDGVRSIIISSLNIPEGVAIDSSGNYIITETQGNRFDKENQATELDKITTDGVKGTIILGLSEATGVAIDSSGNYIVAESGIGTLDKITPAGVKSTIISNLMGPLGVAIDSSGNYIVTEIGLGTLDMITPGGVKRTIISGLISPYGVAIDSSGNYIVAESGVGTLDRIATGGVKSTIISGLGNPVGVAIDSSGYYIVTDASAGTLDKITTAGVKSTIISGLATPFFVAVVPALVSVGSATNSAYTSPGTLGFELTAYSSDNFAAGYSIGHRYSGKVVFIFSDATEVNAATGKLLLDAAKVPYANAVVVGGRATNPTTAYYEDNGFAPLKTQVSGGDVLFFNGATRFYSVSLASLSSTNDYFVLETFQDSGHTVIVMYGIGAPGASAGGVYFDMQFGIISSLTKASYIVHWVGTTPNVPLPADAYTIVYQGP
jgi:sugar lactone lactonase YvrE